MDKGQRHINAFTCNLCKTAVITCCLSLVMLPAYKRVDKAVLTSIFIAFTFLQCRCNFPRRHVSHNYRNELGTVTLGHIHLLPEKRRYKLLSFLRTNTTQVSNETQILFTELFKKVYKQPCLFAFWFCGDTKIQSQ